MKRIQFQFFVLFFSIIFPSNLLPEPRTKNTVLELTPQNAESTIASPGFAIIDFYAEWCGPCKNLKPIFEEVSTELSHYTFAKLNIDNCQQLAKHYGVKSIPTIIVFKDGKVVDKIVGYQTKDLLIHKIKGATRELRSPGGPSSQILNEQLIHAVKSNANPTEIKKLLDAGADVNTLASNGLCPLTTLLCLNVPSGRNCLEIIDLLLTYGASPDVIDPRTSTKVQILDFIDVLKQTHKSYSATYDTIAAMVQEKHKKSN